MSGCSRPGDLRPQEARKGRQPSRGLQAGAVRGRLPWTTPRRTGKEEKPRDTQPRGKSFRKEQGLSRC